MAAAALRAGTTATTACGTAGVGGRRPVSGFLAATVSFVAVFVAGASPIPLYGGYRSADGVSDSGLAIVAVVYFVCAVTTLLVGGRLSDHLGRRPVSMGALVLAAAGCLVLAGVDGIDPLLLGRTLQGIAAGLAASAISSFVVDTAPAHPSWLSSTITTSGTNVGLAIGAFGAGALVDHGPLPRQLTYFLVAGLLGICVVLVLGSADPVRRTPGVLRSLVPQIVLPPAVRPFLPAAIAAQVACWAVGGYYQAFGPSVAVEDLGSTSAVVAATVFASYMAPSALGGILGARFSPALVQRVGMAGVLAATVGLVAASLGGSAVLFIVAGVVGAIGQGLATSATIRALLPEATAGQRAGLLSFVYLISYLGAAVPSLVAGQAVRAVPLTAITVGYAVLALVSFVVVLVAARNPRGA